MAKNAVARTDELDTLPVEAGTTQPVYEVEAGELLHHEIQALATEVGMEKEAATRDTSTIEAQIATLENKLEAEKNRRKYLAEVEAKVTRLIPEPQGYKARMDEAKKLDEAQIKNLEAQLAESNRIEESRNEASKSEYHKNEPKKIEHKPNEVKKV